MRVILEISVETGKSNQLEALSYGIALAETLHETLSGKPELKAISLGEEENE